MALREVFKTEEGKFLTYPDGDPATNEEICEYMRGLTPPSTYPIKKILNHMGDILEERSERTIMEFLRTRWVNGKFVVGNAFDEMELLREVKDVIRKTIRDDQILSNLERRYQK